jgi:hypothetical protein
MRRAVAVLLALSCLGLLLAPAAAQQEEPYAGESNDTGRANWTDGHENVTMRNTTHYLARVGVFVVGDSPSDPGAGPLFVGLVVAGMAVTVLGQSRAGLVASGSMGVVTVAALSAVGGAELLPRWLYGTVVMALGLVLAAVYIRVMR